MVDTRILKGLAKQTSELALSLAGLPGEGLMSEAQALNDVEQMAARILKEVAVARATPVRPVGESSGMWRIMRPARQ